MQANACLEISIAWLGYRGYAGVALIGTGELEILIPHCRLIQ